MAKGFSDNAKVVYNEVKAAQEAGELVTAKDIAEKTGLSARTVNGVITGAFQRKGLMVREEKSVENEEGKTVAVKFIKLTDEGLATDVNAVPDEE